MATQNACHTMMKTGFDPTQSVELLLHILAAVEILLVHCISEQDRSARRAWQSLGHVGTKAGSQSF